MKRFCAIFLALFLVLSFAAAEDPAEGFWISFDEKTDKPNGGWRLYVDETDNRLYGVTVSLADKTADTRAYGCKKRIYKGYPVQSELSNMPIVGSIWIFNLEKQNTGEWSKGNIIDPSTGAMYKCKAIFHKADNQKYKTDTLELRGEIGLGIGKSIYWARATEEEALAIQKQ